jgi:hypothetical protein
MSEICERELRNFDIDTRNITFRKKNSKKARSVIPVLEPAQLPEPAQLSALPESSLVWYLPESPPPQSETPAESQSLFLTGNTPHSTGNAPTTILLQPTISLQSIIRRPSFLA